MDAMVNADVAVTRVLVAARDVDVPLLASPG